MKKVLLVILVFIIILTSCTETLPASDNDDDNMPQASLPEEDVVFDEKGRINFLTSVELKEFFSSLSTFDGNVFEWGEKKISHGTAKKMLEFKDCKIPFSPKNFVNGAYDQCEAFVYLVWDASLNICHLGIYNQANQRFSIYKELPNDELENMNNVLNGSNKIKLEIGDEEFFVALKDEYTYKGYLALLNCTISIEIQRSYYGEDGLESFKERQYRFFAIDELDYVYDADYWATVD